jgi:hypothetical protein
MLNPAQISVDAGSRLRTSGMITLGDYKVLNTDRPLLLENVGNGTGVFSNNKYSMSVTSGQWLVRRSRRFHPYFSGKSQMVECTFDNLQTETNVVKRVGYFSSNAVSPYDASYDGFWIENDGTTLRLKASRAGTSTLDLPWTSWDGYSTISSYDWSKFTVVMFDFLWLGGAILRLWLKTNQGFVLCHSFNYAGSSTDTFIQSPNQPLRYEIRSSTGVGSLRFVCGQVSSETASIDETGVSRYVDSGGNISIASVGTTYPLLSIRKLSAQRDIAVAIRGISSVISTSGDNVIWSVQVNPTLSAALAYTSVSNSAIERGLGNGTITVTSPGTIIAGGVAAQGMPVNSIFETNFLSFLGSTIANVMDECVLCATPLTANVTLYAGMNYKEI